MQINDGFTVVVILESIFVTSNVLSDVSVQVDLSILRENSTDLISFEYKEIHWTTIAIICLLKFLTFVSLVLIGFICRNKREHLKIWIFLGLFFDVILKGVWLGLLLSYHNDVDIPPWEFVAFFAALIFFRGYIYSVSWLAYKELSKGDFRGFGQGFIYLFFYYKNEFQRVARILLTVELIWNFRSLIEGDLPAEMNMILMGLEGNITHFIPEVLLQRGFRIVLAFLALYFVSSESKSCLLFCWLPFKILTICWSVLYIILFGNAYLAMYGNGFNTVVYYLMVINSLGFRSLVIYYVVRFIFVKYNVPVPLHST